MDRPANLFLLQLDLDCPDLLRPNAACPLPDAKHTKWPNFKSGRVWVLQLGAGSNLAAEGTHNDRLQRGLAPRGECLRFDQEIIGKYQGHLHSAEHGMTAELAVKFPDPAQIPGSFLLKS